MGDIAEASPVKGFVGLTRFPIGFKENMWEITPKLYLFRVVWDY